MNVSTAARWSLRLVTWFGLAFLYVPLLVVAILSFNTVKSLSWPPQGFTTDWWEAAWNADGPRDALWNSVKVAFVATLIALVLGTLAAFALQRFRFFGQNTLSFLILLPIALPGIVTAIALQQQRSIARSTSARSSSGSASASGRWSSPTPRSAS